MHVAFRSDAVALARSSLGRMRRVLSTHAKPDVQPGLAAGLDTRWPGQRVSGLHSDPFKPMIPGIPLPLLPQGGPPSGTPMKFAPLPPQRSTRRLQQSLPVAAVVFAVLSGAVSSLRASNQSGPSGGTTSSITAPSSSTTSSQGQPYVPSNVNNQVYSPYPHQNSSVNHPGPQLEMDGRQKEPFFFPPLAPVLGTPIAEARGLPHGLQAPAELAPYINEPFYPQLAGRVSSGDLDRRSRQRVDAYREARRQLEEQAATFVESVRMLPPGARRERLAEFSREMTPRAQDLETRAEALREDLRRNGFQRLLWGSGNWNHERSWVLGEGKAPRTSAESLRLERDVVRAAAYFQEGLSPAQRRLTREIVAELEAEIAAAESAAGTPSVGEALFLLPESARIRFSDTLPRAVAARLEAFGAEKRVLRKELREALFALDAAPDNRRALALAELAEAQEPRFAALEAEAEELRVELANVPDLLEAETAHPIPPDLVRRIQAYENRKLRIQKAVHAQFEEARQQLAPTRVSLARKTDAAGRSALALDVGTPSPSREKLEAVKRSVGEFNREYGPEFTLLSREQLSIREAVSRWAAESIPPGQRGSKSVDDLLRDFDQARQRQAALQRYQAYQDAVLLPGLSPELRRVLYNAALQTLELPLPTAVLVY